MPNERATVAKNDLSVDKTDCIIDASIVLPNQQELYFVPTVWFPSNSMTQHMRRLEYSYIIYL